MNQRKMAGINILLTKEWMKRLGAGVQVGVRITAVGSKGEH